MKYSEIVVNAAAVVANKIGCSREDAVDYIENVVFNSDIDLNAFFKSILG